MLGMILKIFSLKNLSKILALFAQTITSFCKKYDHNIVFFRKTPIFRRKLVKKSQKIEIITSTPGHTAIASSRCNQSAFKRLIF
jgi:hypothetical protein